MAITLASWQHVLREPARRMIKFYFGDFRGPIEPAVSAMSSAIEMYSSLVLIRLKRVWARILCSVRRAFPMREAVVSLPMLSLCRAFTLPGPIVVRRSAAFAATSDSHLRVHHDIAAHLRVSNATESAHRIQTTRFGGGKPERVTIPGTKSIFARNSGT